MLSDNLGSWITLKKTGCDAACAWAKWSIVSRMSSTGAMTGLDNRAGNHFYYEDVLTYFLYEHIVA
jgi:hypothetical protein